MSQVVRFPLLLICAVQIFFALAFFLQLPFAVGLWAFPGTTPLTFMVVAAFLAAASASIFWAVASGSYGSLAGIGLDYAAILAPMAVLTFQLGAVSGDARFTAIAGLAALGVIFGIGLLLWSTRTPIDGTLSMPGPVRWSFVVFMVVLLLVGVLLILGTPNVIPWAITPALSAAIGWMFVGAAIYFAYGLLRPSWLNAAGQLAGFLAYDLVSIVPLLTRLPTVPPQFQAGLIGYLLVITFSGLLALYYLFVHKSTRVWPRRRTLSHET